jgi:signal transduction histidine kinase
MLPPSPVADEIARLDALDRYAILDTSPEAAFDEVVGLAAMICGTPIATIALVDATRQWFKARVGLEATETSRESSFCSHAIAQEGIFLVPDALADPRFADHSMVTSEPYVRFYAGALLTTPEGVNLGMLCVMDRQPRTLTGEQQSALRALARQVIVQLELRRLLAERSAAGLELRRSEARVERLKGDFITTVSHELRTPLTSIRGSLGLLASGVMGELPEEARVMVGVAERNSVRLISVINDILDFDKLQGDRMEMDFRPIPLPGVLERAIDSVGPAARQEGVEIDLHCAETTVMADDARILQVVVNLLSNAVKYSHRGGTITVRAAASVNGWVEVRVEDRGRGIVPELQTRLFGRFQRADSSDSRTRPGTGLGLSICKAIIEQHGGAIGVDSREGEGSTFWFRLRMVGDYADLATSREAEPS